MLIYRVHRSVAGLSHAGRPFRPLCIGLQKTDGALAGPVPRGLVDGLRHAAKQRFGFSRCFAKIGRFEPGHNFFDVGQRGDFFDRAIDEALRQGTLDSRPVPVVRRFPDTALGIATDEFERSGVPERGVCFYERIPADHGHFQGVKRKPFR